MAIEVIEVGPRDGLQNEKQILSYELRSKLIERLSQTGLKRIEVGSFVSPKWVPQMVDSLKVALSTRALMAKDSSLEFSALVPNERGMKDFLKSPLKELSVFTACTESFSKKNINCSIEESFKRFAPVIQLAQKNRIKVRAYLSTVFSCPFEGRVSTKKVVQLAHRLFEAGVYEVSLGDTIGVATPMQVKDLLEALTSSGIQAQKLAGHYHDTKGQALNNVMVSLDFGVKKFDSSVGGLGGCPYAPGSAGNLATEDLICAMEKRGLKTSVSLKKITAVTKWIKNQLR